jgi:hypothetical protein
LFNKYTEISNITAYQTHVVTKVTIPAAKLLIWREICIIPFENRRGDFLKMIYTIHPIQDIFHVLYILWGSYATLVELWASYEAIPGWMNGVSKG